MPRCDIESPAETILPAPSGARSAGDRARSEDTGMSLEDLVIQVQERRISIDDLFEAVDRECRGDMVSYVWHKLKDEADGLIDLALNILVKKIREGEFTPEGPGSVRAYLVETLRNQCRDESKKRERRRKHEVAAEAGAERTSPEPDPSEIVAWEEWLWQLPQLERTVLQMWHHGYTRVEIATELGVSYSEVRNALNAALKKRDEYLAEEC